MSETALPVSRISSLSFRFDPTEDRICCIGVPAGVATGHIEMWVTNRLGFQFLESMHENQPASDQKTDRVETSSDLRDLVTYGYSVEQAREETKGQVSRRDAKAAAPIRNATWLVRRIQVQKKDESLNLILIGEKEAAGCTLTRSQFLRIVDMLEETFRKAEWALPETSYSNIGSKLAGATGSRLN